MTTTTELNAGAELYDTYLIAVLLAEEGNSTQLLGFLNGGVAVFLQRNILTDTIVDQVLYLANLLGCYLLEV